MLAIHHTTLLLALIAVVPAAIVAAPQPQRTKAAHVSVNAPWSATPLALEASEFFWPDAASGESGHLFWKYAETLPAGTIGKNDREQYEAAVAAATQLLSAGELDLLKYALAIRQFSPKLQAHRELWHAAETLGCTIATAVAIVNNRVCVTDPGKPLKQAIKSERKKVKGDQGKNAVADEHNIVSKPDDTDVFDLDHEFKSSNATAVSGDDVVVHLYASIGTDSFLAFHKVLAKKAEDKKIRYIFRHAWAVSGEEQPMQVQGYGVEMAIKNMEYKAVDDQKQEGGASSSEDEKEEDEVAGFDFKVLLQRKPEREVELLSLRDALLSEARQSESKDIKVWALKDLGVQASQRILQSEEPLRLIRDLSHNLPALVNSISRMKVNSTIRAELENNRNYMQPGTNMIFINGRQLHLDALTPYNLYEFVRHEIKMMDSMQALGLDTRSSRRLLNAPSEGGGAGGMGGMGGMGGDGDTFKLDVKNDEHIFWMNDIEKDDMYRQWPSTLQVCV
jgi:UDP-glucose:glycoprotein glucosyltransferase